MEPGALDLAPQLGNRYLHVGQAPRQVLDVLPDSVGRDHDACASIAPSVRAAAAFFAIARRRRGDRLNARACAPFRPRSRLVSTR